MPKEKEWLDVERVLKNGFDESKEPTDDDVRMLLAHSIEIDWHLHHVNEFLESHGAYIETADKSTFQIMAEWKHFRLVYEHIRDVELEKGGAIGAGKRDKAVLNAKYHALKSEALERGIDKETVKTLWESTTSDATNLKPSPDRLARFALLIDQYKKEIPDESKRSVDNSEDNDMGYDRCRSTNSDVGKPIPPPEHDGRDDSTILTTPCVDVGSIEKQGGLNEALKTTPDTGTMDGVLPSLGIDSQDRSDSSGDDDANGGMGDREAELDGGVPLPGTEAGGAGRLQMEVECGNGAELGGSEHSPVGDESPEALIAVKVKTGEIDEIDPNVAFDQLCEKWKETYEYPAMCGNLDHFLEGAPLEHIAQIEAFDLYLANLQEINKQLPAIVRTDEGLIDPETQEVIHAFGFVPEEVTGVLTHDKAASIARSIRHKQLAISNVIQMLTRRLHEARRPLEAALNFFAPGVRQYVEPQLETYGRTTYKKDGSVSHHAGELKLPAKYKGFEETDVIFKPTGGAKLANKIDLQNWAEEECEDLLTSAREAIRLWTEETDAETGARLRSSNWLQVAKIEISVKVDTKKALALVKEGHYLPGFESVVVNPLGSMEFGPWEIQEDVRNLELAIKKIRDAFKTTEGEDENEGGDRGEISGHEQ